MRHHRPLFVHHHFPFAVQVAAAWCLLVQDLLMWQDWPSQLLSLPQFREEWSGGGRGSGNLLFRGPRMR
jgi:hypothetical protein